LEYFWSVIKAAHNQLFSSNTSAHIPSTCALQYTNSKTSIWSKGTFSTFTTSSHLLLASIHPLTSSYWTAQWARHAIHVTWPIYSMNSSQGSQSDQSQREARACRRFAFSFAMQSKKREQTERSIFVAFSKRPCSLFRRSNGKKKSEGRKVRGTLKKIPSGRSARRVPPYNFDLQPRAQKESSMAVLRQAYPVCRKQCNIVLRERFLSLIFFSFIFSRVSSCSEPSFSHLILHDEPDSPHLMQHKRWKGLVSSNAKGGRPWQGPTTITSKSLPPSTLAIDDYARS